MDKALEIGKSSATQSFQLFLGVAGSTIILSIGTFVLAALLDPDQVGLYGMALIPATIIGFFRDWGINSALTQQIARNRAEGKEVEIHDLIYCGIIFEIITGAVLSVICFAIAEPLAYILNPADVAELTYYISIMSVSIFGGALFAASTGIFLGFEQMKLNSFTQIIQAIVRTTLGPLLIVVGFGVLGAVYALVVSTIIGGLLATLLVYVLLFRPLHKNAVSKCNIKATLKPMLSYGLPVAVSTSIGGVLPQVFAFTMAVYAGTNMMGNYYVSTYFIALLSFVAVPVANVLFPVFSKIKPESDLDLIKRVYSSSVKYFSFILVPATMLLMLLSTPAINLLFPNNGFIESLWTINPQPKYPYAPLFLSLSCLAYLLVLVGYFTSATLQNGLMHTRQVMKQSLLSLLVGLLLAFFFVSLLYSIGGPPYAVIAGILGGLIASTITVTWASYWNWKKYKAKPDFRSSLKILVASTIASSPALLFTTLPLPNIVKLVGGCMLFVVTYLTVAPAIGAINEVDIANFQAMLSGLSPLSKVAAVALSVMSKICFFCKKRRVSS